MVAREGRMNAGLGRQIGGRRCDCLDTGLLVVGDDCYLVAHLLLRPRGGPLEELHFTIDAQHLGHFFRKVRVAVFQIVADLVRLYFFLIEDLAHRALRQVGEARVPLGWAVLARMAGEKPRRPQFMRIAQIFRLPTRQRRQPGFRFHRDCRLPAGARAIVQRCHRALGHRSLNAALDRLMMQPECLADRKKRRVFPIAQQDSGSLDPARRFGS
jgi:hypothetical protein